MTKGDGELFKCDACVYYLDGDVGFTGIYMLKPSTIYTLNIRSLLCVNKYQQTC